jgi:hypothetical protein
MNGNGPSPAQNRFSTMKDIPTEELAAISAEIHEAATRVGCTDVSITGRIWPGGQLSGPPGEAARFVEYSWLRAAVVGGRAIFEETDPQAYAALLHAYGLGDEPYPEPASETPPEAEEQPTANARAVAAKVELRVEISLETKRELERQATAGGLTLGEYLDWKFRPPQG